MSDDPTLFDLTPTWAVLHVEGADTDAFLQGQLGNDLRKLTFGHAQISSYSSPKGRMLAVITLTRRDDGSVDIELPRSLAEPITRRLKMFVLRAKLRIVESSEGLIGLRGSLAAEWLAAAGLPVPQQPMAMTARDGVRILRRFGAVPRYTLSAAPEPLQTLRDRWTGAIQSNAERWRLDDIVAGVPVVLPQTQDHFVAQMGNLDRLGGISFDKGCYTGQEIVARLHYLGQLKRRMFLCRGDGPAPEPGTPIHDGDAEQAVGEVVDAAADAGGFAAAVVLQLSHSESPSLRASGVTLTTAQAYDYPAP